MQFQLVKTEKGINVEMFLNFFFCIMFLWNVWGEKKKLGRIEKVIKVM